MIRRIVALALASLVVLALAGAEGGCEDSGQHPSMPQPAPPPKTGKPATPGAPAQPDPAKGDPNPHHLKSILIRFRVGTKAQLPATIHVSTLGGGVQPDHYDAPVADTHLVTVAMLFDPEAPADLSIVAQLVTSQGGNASTCGIEAGMYGNDGPRFTAGKNVVTCYLTVNRPQK